MSGVDGRFWFCLLLWAVCRQFVVEGLGVNWGTRASHPLPADIVVRLLKDNGLKKVKLFEADPMVLRSLGNSDIEVMVGIPNDLLAPLAGSVRAAEDWVQQNVSVYVSKYGVDIRYVAVGNEPFLTSYNGMFTQTTFPALQNIQAAIIKAGLGKQVKATVPLNADVYETQSGLPSGGDFRAEIRTLTVSIIKFLFNNGAPLTINIYPFFNLYSDPNFPVDYAFFSGAANPIVDGSITYPNVFDAAFDTLISALEKNGLPSVEVIIGEVGWPTDGDKNANIQYASKFNQGLLNKLSQGQGSPKRQKPPETYLFGFIDEDAKSIEPGNFERHWGIFYYDGTIKYPLDLGNGRNLVAAKNVNYLDRQWCVMSPDASIMDANLPQIVAEACTYADCTSLGTSSSCGGLDAMSNPSYAFNKYYQTANQQKSACQFSNLSVITKMDPSRDSCRFEVMIDTRRHEKARSPGSSSAGNIQKPIGTILCVVLFWIIGRSGWDMPVWLHIRP
ncbi:glucan endo-1,3-beta-glucosidase 5-like [Aristolochia californica]|uniref:glucan endo-1,3-beta-glucosidase 5-like n=1 Tax=Aristolochia californica TaxID=171875 RepID=UPI0035E0F92B